MGDLTPSTATFKIVKELHVTEDSALYLCTPRHLGTSLENGSVTDSLDRDEPLDTALHEPFKANRLSGRFTSLSKEDLRKLRQLCVVKTYNNIKILRNESDILELLHKQDGSESFIGACILKVQITGLKESSWLCLRPVFSKTLEEFGQACSGVSNASRVPTYFVWHIFLGLLSALEFVHGAGITHGDIHRTNVILNCYAPRSKQHFRDYPTVVLTGFEAGEIEVSQKSAQKDMKNMIVLVHDDVFLRWSDAALLMDFCDAEMQKSDPLFSLASALKSFLNAPLAQLAHFDLKMWGGIAVVQRDKGPQTCPEWIRGTAHDDLVTEEELEKVTQPVLVLGSFGEKIGEYREWARSTRMPVALRERNGKCGLLVLKFETLRQDFADMWGIEDE
ncbi:hypothetical protein N0V90_009995 [Kalmusia sp. IMI 367209]|nr:hypothetical protein N0V90_009995 [Kalmusia sp. IMI 367209]